MQQIFSKLSFPQKKSKPHPTWKGTRPGFSDTGTKKKGKTMCCIFLQSLIQRGCAGKGLMMLQVHSISPRTTTKLTDSLIPKSSARICSDERFQTKHMPIKALLARRHKCIPAVGKKGISLKQKETQHCWSQGLCQVNSGSKIRPHSLKREKPQHMIWIEIYLADLFFFPSKFK